MVESAQGTRAEEDEGSLTSEQQLGLKQAEERLRRDYIHRLVKVRNGHTTKMNSRFFSKKTQLLSFFIFFRFSIAVYWSCLFTVPVEFF